MNRLDHCIDVRCGSTISRSSASFGMYAVCTRNVASRIACRVMYIPAPIGTESHLCASKVIESACSIPCNSERSSGRPSQPRPRPRRRDTRDFRASDLRDGREIVHNSRIGSARCGYHQERRIVLVAILGNGSVQEIGPHPQMFINSNETHGLREPIPQSRAAFNKEWWLSDERP